MGVTRIVTLRTLTIYIEYIFYIVVVHSYSAMSCNSSALYYSIENAVRSDIRVTTSRTSPNSQHESVTKRHGNSYFLTIKV